MGEGGGPLLTVYGSPAPSRRQNKPFFIYVVREPREDDIASLVQQYRNEGGKQSCEERPRTTPGSDGYRYLTKPRISRTYRMWWPFLTLGYYPILQQPRTENACEQNIKTSPPHTSCLLTVHCSYHTSTREPVRFLQQRKQFVSPACGGQAVHREPWIVRSGDATLGGRVIGCGFVALLLYWFLLPLAVFSLRYLPSRLTDPGFADGASMLPTPCPIKKRM